MTDTAEPITEWAPVLHLAADELDQHARCDNPRGDTGTIALAADVRRCAQLINDELTEAKWQHDDRVDQSARVRRAHRGHVLSDISHGRFQARCRCGWESEDFDSEVEAADSLDQHIADSLGITTVGGAE